MKTTSEEIWRKGYAVAIDETARSTKH